MLPQFSFPDFERLQWALPFAVTLHNLEEAIWLPSAAKHLDVLPRQMSPGRFRIGVGVLTVAAYMTTWFSVADGRENAWTYMFVAYTFAMFLNVFVPHLPAAILLKSYAPGVVTAILVNLPVTTVLLAEIWKYRIVHSLGVSILVFGVPLGVAAVAAFLFTTRSRIWLLRRSTSSGRLA
jgi:Protein of unknown function with HXXEE motif